MLFIQILSQVDNIQVTVAAEVRTSTSCKADKARVMKNKPVTSDSLHLSIHVFFPHQLVARPQRKTRLTVPAQT